MTSAHQDCRRMVLRGVFLQGQVIHRETIATHFRPQLGRSLYLQYPRGSSRDKLISANHQATSSPSLLWVGKALEWGHSRIAQRTEGNVSKRFPLRVVVLHSDFGFPVLYLYFQVHQCFQSGQESPTVMAHTKV